MGSPTQPKRSRSRVGRWLLRVAVGSALVSVVGCLGLFLWILAALRPEPADPGLVHVDRPKAPPHRVFRPVEDRGCSVTVQAKSSDGVLDGATARVEVAVGEGDEWLMPAGEWNVDLDLAGRAVLTNLPCGRVSVRVSAPGHLPEGASVDTSEAEPSAVVELLLQAGVRLYGNVRDATGAPIVNAGVITVGAGDSTDADGAYELWADPRKNDSIYASALGFRAESLPLDLTQADEQGLRVDFTLRVPSHDVLVYCAGLPDDSCDDVGVICTAPFVPFGRSCGSKLCRCPDGEAAVRGGGRMTLVAADATEAWLDFRDTATLVGRVLFHGVPGSVCNAIAIRVPQGLEDVPRGGILRRMDDCDDEGAFELVGLVPGDWQLTISGQPTRDNATNSMRTLIPRHLNAGDYVDVGAIELYGGARIVGTVTDGVTGEPAVGEPVVALRMGAVGERPTIFPHGTNANGNFELRGLPAGTWSVAPMLAPQKRVSVVLREGSVANVKLSTSDATAVDKNGFDVTSDKDGELWVEAVDEDGSAAEAGLLPGDKVVNLQLGGFSLPDALEDGRGALIRGILGNWPGPGVTLVIEREGQEVEVPLDW